MVGIGGGSSDGGSGIGDLCVNRNLI